MIAPSPRCFRHPVHKPGILAIAIAGLITPPANGDEFMFRARVDGEMIEGQPLYWTETQMLLLGRDGVLHEFNPAHAKAGRRTAPRFVGYEMRVMKRALYDEFGDRFDLSTTQHYIVVHPRGQRDLWAQRFEDLYRSFHHYFRIRGFRLEEPKYPLVAIVFRNKSEYYQHAESNGTPLQPGYLGHYDQVSNRVFLFDITAGNEPARWSENADTIIHEATHQSAYNAGIHTRFAGTPQWVAEGLATMFEAPGVWDSRSHRSQPDRFNRVRLRDYLFHVRPNWQAGTVKNLVASDQLFQRDTIGAYAMAWGLSFFLSETRPRNYSKYLAATADREMFTPYSAEERIADFESVFGDQWRMIESKFLRYMDELE